MTARKIHFMGVGGVGMAGLALLLKQAGHDVTGCDKYATPRTRWLEANGVPVSTGHDPAHLAGVEELIVTPAVPPSAPELVAARATPSVRVRYRGEVLAERVNAVHGIAVCGTHGKTTTSTFATKLLRALGETPSWCIGGETGAMPVAGPARGEPSDGPLVVEADESDGTLALYRPHVLVLNAVDFDHLEHFASPEAYFDCYRTAVRNTSETVVVCAEHPRAVALARESVAPGARLVTFGFAPDADVNATQWPRLADLVLGRHNVLNALAAIAVALSRGHARAAIEAALPAVLAELPDRRFEQIAAWRPAGGEQVRIYTDYAHHPAELKCAVDMARQLHPKRLRVLFQPHRYSRTRALLEEFPPAFDAADEIVLIPVYAAFEEPVPGGDIADLYAAFRRRGRDQRLLLARSRDEAWRHVFLTLEPGDLVLLAGAGDIVGLLPRVRADVDGIRGGDLPARVFSPLAPFSFFRVGGATCGRIVEVPSALAPDVPRIVAGMGSNSWFSDCATDAAVVRPALPAGAALLAAHPALAFMAGIPGSVGGWAKMNAGAFGHSVSECIDHVVVELEDGSRRTIPAADCGFAYRHSEIPGVIVDVVFKNPEPSASQPAAADYLARRRKFPPRTCGSAFRNPSPDLPAGRLLEEAGAKSLRVGGAAVWSDHANVIVAGEGCTASDVLALARLMARAAFFRSGVKLEPEIRGLEVW